MLKPSSAGENSVEAMLKANTTLNDYKFQQNAVHSYYFKNWILWKKKVYGEVEHTKMEKPL